jgi:hypothetical protein
LAKDKETTDPTGDPLGDKSALATAITRRERTFKVLTEMLGFHRGERLADRMAFDPMNRPIAVPCYDESEGGFPRGTWDAESQTLKPFYVTETQLWKQAGLEDDTTENRKRFKDIIDGYIRTDAIVEVRWEDSMDDFVEVSRRNKVWQPRRVLTSRPG